MVVAQGDIFWVDFAEPIGSAPGFVRPAVVVQGEDFNASRIATVVVVPLTSQLKWSDSPGNVLLTKRATGLPSDSVANVSQVTTVDRSQLLDRAGRLTEMRLNLMLDGITTVLGR